MTADERIEKLLNRFGQTISDLPKPDRELYGPYSSTSRMNYYYAARKWFGQDSRMPDMAIAYGCHLCDVIDRLEIALETAAKWADCGTCEVDNTDVSEGTECNYRLYDRFLSDVSDEYIKRYIDDAD